MKLIIKKPNIGEKIESEELGIQGTVLEIFESDIVFGGYTPELLNQARQELLKKLDGELSLYFEVQVLVTAINEGSEYQEGDTMLMTWEEYQRCKVIDNI